MFQVSLPSQECLPRPKPLLAHLRSALCHGSYREILSSIPDKKSEIEVGGYCRDIVHVAAMVWALSFSLCWAIFIASYQAIPAHETIANSLGCYRSLSPLSRDRGHLRATISFPINLSIFLWSQREVHTHKRKLPKEANCRKQCTALELQSRKQTPGTNWHPDTIWGYAIRVSIPILIATPG